MRRRDLDSDLGPGVARADDQHRPGLELRPGCGSRSSAAARCRGTARPRTPASGTRCAPVARMTLRVSNASAPAVTRKPSPSRNSPSTRSPSARGARSDRRTAGSRRAAPSPSGTCSPAELEARRLLRVAGVNSAASPSGGATSRRCSPASRMGGLALLARWYPADRPAWPAPITMVSELFRMRRLVTGSPTLGTAAARPRRRNHPSAWPAVWVLDELPLERVRRRRGAEETPSLAKMLLTCRSTVRSLSTSCSAMARLVTPVATSRSTSTSRGSAGRPTGAAGRGPASLQELHEDRIRLVGLAGRGLACRPAPGRPPRAGPGSGPPVRRPQGRPSAEVPHGPPAAPRRLATSARCSVACASPGDRLDDRDPAPVRQPASSGRRGGRAVRVADGQQDLDGGAESSTASRHPASARHRRIIAAAAWTLPCASRSRASPGWGSNPRLAASGRPRRPRRTGPGAGRGCRARRRRRPRPRRRRRPGSRPPARRAPPPTRRAAA